MSVLNSTISPKQKKAIKNIEIVTGIKFTGKSQEEASKFLDENLPKLEGVDFRKYKKPSAKMEKGIKFCESILGVEFQGSTMLEASEFLGKYLQKAIDTVNKGKKGGGKSGKR